MGCPTKSSRLSVSLNLGRCTRTTWIWIANIVEIVSICRRVDCIGEKNRRIHFRFLHRVALPLPLFFFSFILFYLETKRKDSIFRRDEMSFESIRRFFFFLSFLFLSNIAIFPRHSRTYFYGYYAKKKRTRIIFITLSFSLGLDDCFFSRRRVHNRDSDLLGGSLLS